MHTKALIAELERSGWEGEVCGDGTTKGFRVGDDGFEVLDADDDMHLLLHMEVFEVFSVDGYRSLERLL